MRSATLGPAPGPFCRRYFKLRRGESVPFVKPGNVSGFEQSNSCNSACKKHQTETEPTGVINPCNIKLASCERFLHRPLKTGTLYTGDGHAFFGRRSRNRTAPDRERNIHQKPLELFRT